MDNNVVDEFLNIIMQKNGLQNKYLSMCGGGQKREELKDILQFFLEEYNYSLEYIADSYLFLNNIVLEESYYFAHNGVYRNSSFEEVNKSIYGNEQFMQKYMTGLTVSDYLWTNHIKMIEFFETHLDHLCGDKYLEIGPGFGQFLIKVLLYGRFSSYTACDISLTSVMNCNKFLKYNGLDYRCTVIQKDFFEFTSDGYFDGIVMGEVLEHVEKPVLMLEKIFHLLSEKGTAFLTTVINSPMIDHIFLFASIDEVLDMVRTAGFSVIDYMCATAGDIPLEKAIKKKRAINIAMLLKKNGVIV